MSYSLGVDIGTTTTTAAIWRDGRARSVRLSDVSNAIPSAVLLLPDDEGSMLVGEAAVRRGVVEPDRLARGFKSGLADPTPMLLGDNTIARTELTGQLLRFVLEQVTALEGDPPAQVTLTIPASWGAHHRELMSRVAAEAGVAVVYLLTEPVAVALHYAAQQGMRDGEVVAVYDLGGGTFDTAVVEAAGGEYRLRGRPGGLETVGGEDFDRAVMAHVGRALGNTLAGLDRSADDVAQALRRVEQNAIAAKEALSADVDATITVGLPGMDPRRIRLTRGEFEGAIRVPVLQTVAALDATIESAGFEPDQVAAVLLAGGSSRIPLVSRLIGENLGIAVVTDAQPTFAVCLGAAIAAGRRQLTEAAKGTTSVPQAVPPAARAVAEFDVARRSGRPGTPADGKGAEGKGADSSGVDGTARPADPITDVDDAGAGWDPAADAGVSDELPPEVAALLAVPEAQVVADPARIGLRRPPDVPLRAAPGIRPTLRYLSDRDTVSVTYTGRRRKALRPVLVGVAVVVAVVAGALVVSGQGWFDRGGAEATDVGSSVSAPVSASPADAESATPTADVEAPVVPATPIAVSGPAGEEMRGVAVLADGYVSVGGVGGSAPTATVWIGDGQVLTPSAGPTVAGRTTQLTAVAGGRQRLVVTVGWSAEPGAADDPARRRGEIWASSDGRRWVPATLNTEVGELTAVAALPGGGYLAAGQDFTREPAEGDAIVLTSADGAVWDVLPSTGLDGPGPMALRALAADPAGGLIAIGAQLDGARTRTGLWRSASGADWTFDQWLTGTDAAGSGLAVDQSGVPVVVGAVGGRSALWRAENGSLVAHLVDTATGSRLLGVAAGTPGPATVGSAGGSSPAPSAWLLGEAGS